MTVMLEKTAPRELRGGSLLQHHRLACLLRHFSPGRCPCQVPALAASQSRAFLSAYLFRTLTTKMANSVPGCRLRFGCGTRKSKSTQNWPPLMWYNEFEFVGHARSKHSSKVDSTNFVVDKSKI